MYWQVLAEHVGAVEPPEATVPHDEPQAPQLVALLVVSVSQPSVGSLLQSPQPALQVRTQAFEVHAAETTFAPPVHTLRPLHVVPHAAVVLSEVSQPFVAMPSQSSHPELQVV
jgi:hypothetical protein